MWHMQNRTTYFMPGLKALSVPEVGTPVTDGLGSGSHRQLQCQAEALSPSLGVRLCAWLEYGK